MTLVSANASGCPQPRGPLNEGGVACAIIDGHREVFRTHARAAAQSIGDLDSQPSGVDPTPSEQNAMTRLGLACGGISLAAIASGQLVRGESVDATVMRRLVQIREELEAFAAPVDAGDSQPAVGA